MDRKRWLITLTAVLMLANAVLLVCARNWSALAWLLYGGWAFYVMLSQQKTIAEYHDLTREQEEHIHYLTDHDTWRQIRISETKAQNCLRYLKRIGELKMQVEQLKILNHNLTKYAYGHKAKKSNTR